MQTKTIRVKQRDVFSLISEGTDDGGAEWHLISPENERHCIFAIDFPFLLSQKEAQGEKQQDIKVIIKGEWRSRRQVETLYRYGRKKQT